MRFGFCTNFATKFSPDVNYKMLEDIKQAGYDYVELPVMQIASLSEDEFEKLKSVIRNLQLDCDCACNLFPKEVRVTGAEADTAQIQAYLEKAVSRCAELNIKKLIFGSAPARNLDSATSQEEGYDQIITLCEELLLPLSQKQGMKVLIEAIGPDSANFINTLEDGMHVVKAVSSPGLTLLADLKHMQTTKESPLEIEKYASQIDHVHVAEIDQSLPAEFYSPELEQLLETIKQTGYDKTLSFETSPYEDPAEIRDALVGLKRRMKR